MQKYKRWDHWQCRALFTSFIFLGGFTTGALLVTGM